MHQATSKYADHERVTWFGRGGTVAYVDYQSRGRSYFIGRSGDDFCVVPLTAGSTDMAGEISGFATIDDGIAHALNAVG